MDNNKTILLIVQITICRELFPTDEIFDGQHETQTKSSPLIPFYG